MVNDDIDEQIEAEKPNAEALHRAVDRKVRAKSCCAQGSVRVRACQVAPRLRSAATRAAEPERAGLSSPPLDLPPHPQHPTRPPTPSRRRTSWLSTT
jgi:hypothetical protein